MKAAIYRLQLFKPSEGFIAAQAKALPSVDPHLVGRALFGPADPQLPYSTPERLDGVALGRFLTTSYPGAFEPLVRALTPDIIHAHFAVDALYAVPLARRLDLPLITTLHGFDVTTSRTHFLRSGRPALVRYALLQERLKRVGAHFICVSRFIYDAAVRAGFPESRLSVHYIGIDTSLFVPMPPAGPPRLMHVARLVEKKGTRFLIESMRMLRKKFPDLVLDIVGDGPLKATLVAQAAALNLRDAVHFHGTQSHFKVREMLQGSIALVLPSITASNGDAEGLGLVLLEASASGVPVIGTRHGGIPEAVCENESGFLVPERDSKSLAEAIDAIISDGTLQRCMGQAGRQLACTRFDIHRQSCQLETIYRRLI